VVGSLVNRLRENVDTFQREYEIEFR